MKVCKVRDLTDWFPTSHEAQERLMLRHIAGHSPYLGDVDGDQFDDCLCFHGFRNGGLVVIGVIPD